MSTLEVELAEDPVVEEGDTGASTDSGRGPEIVFAGVFCGLCGVLTVTDSYVLVLLFQI